MSLSILPAYSPSDTGAIDALAVPAYDVKGAPDPAPVALSADGFIRSCPLDEIVERFLSHMLEAVAALRLTRNSISFCLTEETAFIRPPWARDRVDESFKDGAGGSVRGFVNIVSTAHRLVQDVRITLTGTQRVIFPNGASDEFEVFQRELSLAELTGCGLVELQRGVNCFEFSLIVPKTTPVSVSSQYGRLRYSLKAQVPGSGSFLRGRLSTERVMHIVGLPERSEEDEMRFDVDEQSNGEWSGQARLEIRSDRLTIGEPVACKLTLASPPSNLTIFGIHVYLRQTVGIRSPSSAETTTVVSPKRTILQAGYLDRWAVPDFVARAKREHRSELLFDGTSQSGQKGEVWKWEADGVLPVDNTLKPTTIYYLDAMDGLTFAHQLVFDVYFQQDGAGVKDDRLMVASMCGQDVTVASSSCNFESLTLPQYAEKPTASASA